MFDRFLGFGADVRVKNNLGDTLSHIVVEFGQVYPYKHTNTNMSSHHLSSLSLSFSLSLSLSPQGHLLPRLVKLGCDLHCKNYRGYTPLHVASRNNNSGGMCERLVALGARVNEVFYFYFYYYYYFYYHYHF